jgi:hypothetical protein
MHIYIHLDKHGSLDAREISKRCFCTGNKPEVRKYMVLFEVAIKIVVMIVIRVVVLTLFSEHKQKFNVRNYKNTMGVECMK